MKIEIHRSYLILIKFLARLSIVSETERYNLMVRFHQNKIMKQYGHVFKKLSEDD